jgi:DNA polymerase-3 subunit delta'
MTSSLLLNESTQRGYETFKLSPSHGLLIIGAEGSGKLLTAKHLAADILKLEFDKLTSYQYIKITSPINNSITIENVRDIKAFLALKTTGENKLRRVVIISNAELMSNEAQNAILKQLEEPPLDTILLLTTSDSSRIQKTLLSRLSTLRIQRPSLKDTVEFFAEKGFEKNKIEKDYLITNGAVGVLFDLLTSNPDSKTIENLNVAKKILTSKNYDRLRLIDELSKDKESLHGILQSLKQLFRAVLIQSINKKDMNTVRRSLDSLELLLKITDSNNNNPNTKLLITNLMVGL